MSPIRGVFLILFLSTLSCCKTLDAQPYKTSLGIRGPFAKGITLKHFIGEQSALEGIAALRYRGFLFTGLYERHAQAFGVEGLYWYYGAGGHLGTWNDVDEHPWYDDGPNTAIGVDGVIGLEYDIGAIPFNVGIDYKPAINLIGAPGDPLWFDAGGVSFRYIF